MKKNLIIFKFLPVIGILFFSSCEKDDIIDEQPKVTPTSGVLILNQGSQGVNNSGITYYDYASGTVLDEDIMDGRLGDTAQDMLVYGGKIYVSVTKSSVIWVLSLSNFDELGKIYVNDGAVPREPNFLAAYENKVYATTIDGHVIRIDTASLAIDAITAVGADPLGIAAAEGKLYVGNTNGLNFPNFDNTLSVIDIATFSEVLPRIEVGLNPNRIKYDGNENLYITYLGNYADVAGGIQKIDLKTRTVVNISNVPANQDFTILNDTLYYYGVTYNDKGLANNVFGRYDLKNGRQIAGNLISEVPQFTTVYAFGIDDYSRDIYVADTDYSNPSTIYIFDRNGKKKSEFTAGINAYKFVFI
ncbi:MAG: hypothetical protein LBR64_00075 [Dysgonamonadaceae bacterium]|jgi:hypothetical protein|nr:hypothetical protein [Dysgonamonadaceae bacterium]